MAKKFLALGDSYTIGEGVDAPASWPLQLADALRQLGVAIENPRVIATTGWTTAELELALDDVAPLGNDWDLVTLLIGVNDQYRGFDLPAFATGFDALLHRAVEYAGGEASRVVVVTIPDWGITPFAAKEGRNAPDIAHALDSYNAHIADQAQFAGAQFADIAATARACNTPDMWVDDALHPSATQYAQWTRIILPQARAAIEHA